jgi:hypothetical protein
MFIASQKNGSPHSVRSAMVMITRKRETMLFYGGDMALLTECGAFVCRNL